MVLLLPLLTSTLVANIDGEFKVASSERRIVFAGKLGRRIEDVLTVEKDGQRYEIRLGRAHTACTRNIREYAAGDTVDPAAIGWGSQIRKID